MPLPSGTTHNGRRTTTTTTHGIIDSSHLNPRGPTPIGVIELVGAPAPRAVERSSRDPRVDAASIHRALHNLVTGDNDDEDEDEEDEDEDPYYRMFNPFMLGNDRIGAPAPAPRAVERSSGDPRVDADSIHRALHNLVTGDNDDEDYDEDEDDEEDDEDEEMEFEYNRPAWQLFFGPGMGIDLNAFLMSPAERRALEREEEEEAALAAAATVRRRGAGGEEGIDLTGDGSEEEEEGVGGDNERRGGGKSGSRRGRRGQASEGRRAGSGTRGAGEGAAAPAAAAAGGRVRIVNGEANPGRQGNRFEDPPYIALAEMMRRRREMGGRGAAAAGGGEDGGGEAARARRMAGWMWQREQREQGHQQQQQQREQSAGNQLQQQQQQQQQRQEQGQGPGQPQQRHHHHRHHPHHHHHRNPMMRMPRFGAIMNDLSALHQALAGARAGALPPALLFSDRDFTDADYEMLLALDENIENRRGATQQDIDKIDTFRVPRNMGGSGSGGKTKCVICLEDCKTNEILRKMKCGHAMHKVCLDKWLKTRAVCPICLQHI